MTGTQQTDARPTPPRRAGHQPPPAARAAGLVIAITAVLAVIAMAFALDPVHFHRWMKARRLICRNMKSKKMSYEILKVFDFGRISRVATDVGFRFRGIQN